MFIKLLHIKFGYLLVYPGIVEFVETVHMFLPAFRNNNGTVTALCFPRRRIRIALIAYVSFDKVMKKCREPRQEAGQSTRNSALSKNVFGDQNKLLFGDRNKLLIVYPSKLLPGCQSIYTYNCDPPPQTVNCVGNVGNWLLREVINWNIEVNF